MQFRSIRTRLGFWFMFMFLIALIAFALVLSIQRIADTEDRSEIFAPMRSMLVSVAVGLSTLLILAYLVVRQLSKSLTSPVLSMAKTMREMQAGDFAARSTVERSDEIGFLADSFNALADIIVGQLAVKQDVARITEGLVSASGLQTAVSTLVYTLVETTGSNLGAVFLMNEKTRKLDLLASVGADDALLQNFDLRSFDILVDETATDHRISHVKDVPQDTPFRCTAFGGAMIPRELITIPLVAAGRRAGIVCLASLEPFARESIEIINQTRAAMSASLAHHLAGEKARRLTEEVTLKNEELEVRGRTLQEKGKEREAQNAKVEQTSHLKSEFLTHMSHELRTPLNAILALSGVLVRRTGRELSAREADYLQIIEQNANRLLQSIDRILDLSRIEAGAVGLRLAQLSPGSIIRSVVDSLEPLAEMKGIEISREIPADLPRIASDEIQLFHILQNLIDNALKFTEEGNVTISATSDAHEVRITVTDTGIGIREEDLGGIFEPFKQVAGASSGGEGIGLGLAIARKASLALGGRISVESTVGRGSRFSLFLPIAWKGSMNEQRIPAPKAAGIRNENGTVDDNPDDWRTD